MKNTSIYVVTQKVPCCKLEDHYIWIQSGTNDKNRIDNILHDNDMLDNRADKNKYYSEYSAHYYIWKQDLKSDYIGLSHYRRFFDNGSFSIRPITKKKIEKIMSKYDVILPYHEKFEYSIQDCYMKWHNKKDLYYLYSSLMKYDNDFYTYFIERMNMHEMSMRNLFITKRSIANEYWEWIFGLFDMMEKEFELGERDPYQSRVFGYYAERLLEPWMLYNGYRIKYSFLYNTEEKNNRKKRLFLLLKDFLGRYEK